MIFVGVPGRNSLSHSVTSFRNRLGQRKALVILSEIHAECGKFLFGQTCYIIELNVNATSFKIILNGIYAEGGTLRKLCFN